MHLDTSFLIDLQKERAREVFGGCHEFLQKHCTTPMRVSSVAAMEYLEGFSDADVLFQSGFLKIFDLVAVDFPVAQRASRIRRDLRSAGKLLPDADILIATCAIHHAEPLVTANTEHFSRIQGLSLVGYTS